MCACVCLLKSRDIKVRASPVDEMLHKAAEVVMRLIAVVSSLENVKVPLVTQGQMWSLSL